MNTFKPFIFVLLFYLGLITTTNAQVSSDSAVSIIVGAQQTNKYFPLLMNKRVALVANQTSVIDSIHLVDTMLAAGIPLELVFSPEHGFRGKADAGQYIANEKDAKTGLPLVSLYGKNKKPSPGDLHGIDLVVFDIQDVGVRYYTYISTLHYVMEACAELHIPVLVLDRPNPNGFYVDGPILDTSASSFVGMHPVPLVHGMTIAEYALMINGESWLTGRINCNLMVLPCLNYNHKSPFTLPIKPSPNLPNDLSILLYPSLGLFEGTIMSVGRGTNFPFQVYGHPDFKKGDFEFTPQSMNGAKYPKFKAEQCLGMDLRDEQFSDLYTKGQVNLEYILTAYRYFKKEPEFFNTFFYRLAGSHTLRQQIEKGLNEEEIRLTWQDDLKNYMRIRSNYLLYDDF